MNLTLGIYIIVELVRCVLRTGLVVFVISFPVGIVQRYVQVQSVTETLRSEQVIMMLPIVIRLVIVEFRFAVLLIGPATVVTTVCFKFGRINPIPCLISHFAAAESLELDHCSAVVICSRAVIRIHIRPGAFDIPVGLHIRIARIKHEMLPKQSRPAAESIRKCPETTGRRNDFEVRFKRWTLSLHRDSCAESGRTIGRGTCSALNLNIFDRRSEIGHVHPKDPVTLRIVDRYTVDRKIDPVSIRTAHPHGCVAYTIPTVGSNNDRRCLHK